MAEAPGEAQMQDRWSVAGSRQVDHARTRRRRRRSVWIAAIALPLIFAGAALWAVPRIERDLEGQARSALIEAGIRGVDVDSLEIEASGEDLTVRGALDLVAAAEIRRLLLDKDLVTDAHEVTVVTGGWSVYPAAQSEASESVAGPASSGAGPATGESTAESTAGAGGSSEPEAEPVESPAATPATAPVDVTATVADGAITLAGSTPSETERARLVDAARAAFGVDRAVDELSVPGADATPAGIAGIETLSASMPAIATGLTTGRVVLHENELTITGEAADQAAADALSAVVGAEAAVRQTRVTPDLKGAGPDASSEAAVTGVIEGGRISLTGVVPTAADRHALLAAAAAAFGDGLYDEAVEVAGEGKRRAGGAGLDGAIALLPDLSRRLVSGEVTVAGRTVSVVGTTATNRGKTAIVTRLAAQRVRGATVTSDLSLSPALTAVDLERYLNVLVRRRPIRFATGSAIVLPSNRRLLDVMARQIRRARGFRLRVAGHTDDRGDAAANLELSRARAAAVVEQLARRRIDRTVLVPVGYGETRPLVPNTTAAGRAQNRRVVFRARKA